MGMAGVWRSDSEPTRHTQSIWNNVYTEHNSVCLSDGRMSRIASYLDITLCALHIENRASGLAGMFLQTLTWTFQHTLMNV